MNDRRLAVVLFNLGGPDSPAAVEPFLRNLFSDRAIIGLPMPLRGWLARLIARRRAPIARDIYARIGGASPLLPLTREQAAGLQARLVEAGWDARVFVAMRYWHPLAPAVAAEVKAFDPHRLVLLPLYPQFSTTTSGSSLQDWQRAADAAGVRVPSAPICCYPTEPGWIAAVARLSGETIAASGQPSPVRLLFSAHGLPERVVARGDPYPWQVEQTVAAVIQALGPAAPQHVLCYQSRVGPLKWIGPSIEDELARAAADGMAVVVVPIAFVSEHSETLVELDIEYAERAREMGVPGYVRVPAVGTAPEFIDGLARLVQARLAVAGDGCAAGTACVCPSSKVKCVRQRAGGGTGGE